VIIPGVGSSPESILESMISLDLGGRPLPSLVFFSFGGGPGAGVEVLGAGPPDFEAGPPAGGREDFLFSPGFEGVVEGVAVVLEPPALGVRAGPVRRGWKPSIGTDSVSLSLSFSLGRFLITSLGVVCGVATGVESGDTSVGGAGGLIFSTGVNKVGSSGFFSFCFSFFSFFFSFLSFFFSFFDFS